MLGHGAGFFGDYARRMHLVMYDAELRQIKNVMDKHCKQEGYKVIAVNEGYRAVRAGTCRSRFLHAG